MRTVFKPPFIIGAAVLINLVLFILIQQLVTNEIVPLPRLEELRWVDYIRLEQHENPVEEAGKSTLPDEPPPPEQPPQLPELAAPDMPEQQQLNIEIPAPGIHVPLAIDGVPYAGDYLKSTPPVTPALPTDIATDIIPDIRVEPVYPARALRAGIEGLVTAEFTITTDGSVKDIKIVKADPPEIFDQSVIQAIQKWKFSPQIENGQAVEKRARQDIRFTLKK
jgi:protein TonB